MQASPTYQHLQRLARSFRSVAVLTLLATLLSAPAQAQEEIPEFDVDVVSMRPAQQSTGSEIDIYTRIPYARLRFINTAEGFTARYQVSAQIFDVDDEGRRHNIIDSPIWDRMVRVPNYAETQDAGRFDFTTHTVSLEPGPYYIEFQLEDQESAESYVSQTLATVRDFDRDVVMSDILVLEDFDEESNTIYPSVSSRIGSDLAGFRLFYEVYMREPGAIRISHEMLFIGSASLKVRPGEVNVVGDAAYQDTEEKWLEAGTNQHIVLMPFDGLQVGQYLIRVRALSSDGDTVIDQAETIVFVEWNGLAQHIENLDSAISQLQYIAKNKELKYIRAGETTADRLDRFNAFWSRRDPTPGTTRNERMEEYYFRVAYANRRYSSLTEGWRTDRGEVVVLFGEPDYVDPHPYTYNTSPYEIWYYYRIGRQFVFVDRTGFGDYQLLVPYWDDRTHIR